MEVNELARYVIRYWFEHGGCCLWSKNEEARIKFNYNIRKMTRLSHNFNYNLL